MSLDALERVREQFNFTGTTTPLRQPSFGPRETFTAHDFSRRRKRALE